MSDWRGLNLKLLVHLNVKTIMHAVATLWLIFVFDKKNNFLSTVKDNKHHFILSARLFGYEKEAEREYQMFCKKFYREHLKGPQN